MTLPSLSARTMAGSPVVIISVVHFPFSYDPRLSAPSSIEDGNALSELPETSNG